MNFRSYRKEQQRLRAKMLGRIAGELAARAVVFAFIAGAVVALFWKGLPTALAVLAGAGLFALARPGPDDEL